jgi:hypothetical protein
MVGYLKDDTLQLEVDVIIDESDFNTFVSDFEKAIKNTKTDVLLTYREDLNLYMLVDYLSQRYRAVFRRKSEKSRIFLIASRQFH